MHAFMPIHQHSLIAGLADISHNHPQIPQLTENRPIRPVLRPTTLSIYPDSITVQTPPTPMEENHETHHIG